MRIVHGKRSLATSGVGITLAMLAGCNSFDKQPDVEPHLEIPLDERPAVRAAQTPKPISGGTVSVLKDGSRAIIADPDRDRVSIVDLKPPRLASTVALEPGDEPGRTVEDASGHVHVVLRSGAAIATIDPGTGKILERRPVCKAPRGIAYESSTDLVHVACAEGALVSLPAAGGEAVRTLALDPDLRDVVVQGSELWVTRFKSAEILRVSSGGAVNARVALPKTAGTLSVPPPKTANPNEPSGGPSMKAVTMSQGVAWRVASNPSGGAVLLHEQQLDDDVTISDPSQTGSSYGGGGMPCDGIVRQAVTQIAPDGTSTINPVAGSPLAVDVAVSADQWLAVAHAGAPDPSAPRPFMVFPSKDGSATGVSGPAPAFGDGTVSLLRLSELGGPDGCSFSRELVNVTDPATAVAFTPGGQLLVQTREPARLVVVNVPDMSQQMVDLEGDSLLDTGHELFHRDAGGGVACASCHPEGGEDGHTWHFAGAGPRRTQALHVGLQGTAPFHWNGDLPDVAAVMSQVFVGRMGGVNESADRTNALSDWLFALKRPPALRDVSDPAAARGKALFESATVGCTTCHSGDKFTDNKSVAIDTAREKLQVPSLLAVGYRSPFMHDGCAQTLAARFDPKCGGNSHGNTADLAPAQVDDLVAYLESL